MYILLNSAQPPRLPPQSRVPQPAPRTKTALSPHSQQKVARGQISQQQDRRLTNAKSISLGADDLKVVVTSSSSSSGLGSGLVSTLSYSNPFDTGDIFSNSLFDPAPLFAEFVPAAAELRSIAVNTTPTTGEDI